MYVPRWDCSRYSTWPRDSSPVSSSPAFSLRSRSPPCGLKPQRGFLSTRSLMTAATLSAPSRSGPSGRARIASRSTSNGARLTRGASSSGRGSSAASGAFLIRRRASRRAAPFPTCCGNLALVVEMVLAHPRRPEPRGEVTPLRLTHRRHLTTSSSRSSATGPPPAFGLARGGAGTTGLDTPGLPPPPSVANAASNARSTNFVCVWPSSFARALTRSINSAGNRKLTARLMPPSNSDAASRRRTHHRTSYKSCTASVSQLRYIVLRQIARNGLMRLTRARSRLLPSPRGVWGCRPRPELYGLQGLGHI
jgi:hypothetical protein